MKDRCTREAYIGNARSIIVVCSDQVTLSDIVDADRRVQCVSVCRQIIAALCLGTAAQFHADIGVPVPRDESQFDAPHVAREDREGVA